MVSPPPSRSWRSARRGRRGACQAALTDSFPQSLSSLSRSGRLLEEEHDPTHRLVPPQHRSSCLRCPPIRRDAREERGIRLGNGQWRLECAG